MKKDLISRQKLRMALYHEAFELDSDDQRWDGGCWIRYKMFERVVESMPTESERERGKWRHDKSEWKYRFICSECGYRLLGEQTNFCPNCGAEMKGEEDE